MTNLTPEEKQAEKDRMDAARLRIAERAEMVRRGDTRKSPNWEYHRGQGKNANED